MWSVTRRQFSRQTAADAGAPVTRHKSMYGVGPGFTNLAGDPYGPIGPDIANQNDWWFRCVSLFAFPGAANCHHGSQLFLRGPEYRALKPQNASVMELPVGSSVDVEIACKCVHGIQLTIGFRSANHSDTISSVAWTTYGERTTDNDAELSACPENYGAWRMVASRPPSSDH